MNAEPFQLAEELGEAERLAAGYAPRALQPAYRALLAFDAVLRRIALSAREPLPAQIKLAWWREACRRLPEGREHPVLAALAAHWRRDPLALAALVDAWEEFAVGGADILAAADGVARQRAAMLAVCAGGPAVGALAAAYSWTLVELANRASDPAVRSAMLESACARPTVPLPRTLRPLAVLAGLARRAGARGGGPLLGDRLSPLAAVRLGIFGR